MKWIVLPALLLSACAPEVVSAPPAHRFEPVAMPAYPEPTATCDDDADGVTEPCLSDAQVGNLMNELIDALEVANGRLSWLADYFSPE